MRKWVLLLILALFLTSYVYIETNVSWYINQFLDYVSSKIDPILKNADKSQLFLEIFAGSITILAIVFSVSQFTISHLSTNYSPYILEKYRKNLRFIVTFCLFLFLVLISLISATFANSNSLIYSAILILFVFGLILLFAHFEFVLTLLDPNKILKLLQEDIRKSISKGRTDEFADYITSMGDIATKSLVRKEENITLEYVNGFYSIFENYLTMLNSKKSKNLKKFRIRDPIIGDYLFIGEESDIVSKNIYSHLERVFLSALRSKEKRVTTDIASKFFNFTLDILKKGDDALFRELIDTKFVRGAVYFQFFKNAMEHRDESKEVFVRNLFSILQFHLFLLPDSELNRSQLNQLIDFHLFRMNKLVLDHDDFELFWKEMDLASKMINFQVLHPNWIINDVIDKIHEMARDVNELYTHEMIERINECPKHKLFRNFNPEEFRNSLNTLKKQLQERVVSEGDQEGIEEKFREVVKSLEKYETIARLHRTFFLLGAYILFLRGQNEKFDHVKYIKELWEHTSPEDADAHHINKTPVCFDPLWLMYLITYGGENSIIWFDKYDFEFKGYHGIRDYVYQYWILLMGRWERDLEIPDENKIKNWKNNDYEFKLKFWRELLNNFLFYHKDKIETNFRKILDNKLYVGVYEEEDLKNIKEKFVEIVSKMENTLKTLQKELNQS